MKIIAVYGRFWLMIKFQKPIERKKKQMHGTTNIIIIVIYLSSNHKIKNYVLKIKNNC